jgi:hypothetical protein
MNEMKQEFNLNDGRKVFFRTVVKQPYAIEGVPNVHFCWADECGLYPRLAYVNIIARLALRGGRCIMTSTPYAQNWFWKDVIKPYEEGKAKDIHVERWSSIANPAFSKEQFEVMKEKLSKKEFERKFLGVHNKMEGLIFEDFTDNNLWEPFPLTDKMPVYGGVDWGFDHATAIVIRAFPGDGCCYTVSIFKKSGLSASQVVEVIRAKAKLFNVKMFYCGADRPDLIKELQMNGVRAVKYFENELEYREVNPGNQKHAELIRSRQYKVFRGIDQIEDLEDEYATYSWKKKEFEDETAKEKPMDINDDLMAAERYATVGTFRLLKEKFREPEIPLNIKYTIDDMDFGEEEKSEGWMGY